MQLKEFIAQEKAILDDFEYTYTQAKSKGRESTMFHPESEWRSRWQEFYALHADIPVDNMEAA